MKSLDQLTHKFVNTYTVRIYIAGDYDDARRICRQECYADGLCVTVERCDFVYTGGEEAGVCVGLLNYPRFPSNGVDVSVRAEALAQRLLVGLCQQSVLVVTPTLTHWYSRHE